MTVRYPMLLGPFPSTAFTHMAYRTCLGHERARSITQTSREVSNTALAMIRAAGTNKFQAYTKT